MKIKIFRSIPNLYSIQNWSIDKCPVLIITGLSGSGKTTYSQIIAKKYDAICISFDVLKFYDEAPIESKRILNGFIKDNPHIKSLIQINWRKTDSIYSNDMLYNYYCNLFFDYIVKYAHEKKKLLILEGIQIFVRLHPSKTLGMPLIVIGSSSFQSLKRKYIRDFPTNCFILSWLIDIYIYQIKQRTLLNHYIQYQESITLYRKDD